ncbi:MAG: SDR family oxidoreductase [Sandaracinaceae bacterium]|nr:SDR family oxidoreductase [Sandaracinaceae bacterium]
MTDAAIEKDLAGRTAIVTGSSRGIGRAIALELAERGASVVLAARTVVAQPPWAKETIHDTAREITEAGGRALACAVDVRDEAQVRAMVAAALDAFGSIDVLVNNAGAFKLKPAVSMAPRELQLVLDVNVAGAFNCIAAALPYLSRSPRAHIVNVAPPLRTEPYWAAGKLAHAVSKLALTTLTLGLADELKPARIAVNAIWPKTPIATIGIERLGGEALVRMARKPEIMAQAVAAIVVGDATGSCVLDEDVLRAQGVTDFSRFAVDPSMPLAPNYFVDPAELV